MASAFKKFKQLENQKESPPQNKSSEERPARKKLQTYNHIVSKFETLDGDERKKIVQERLKQRQMEKEAKLEEERKRKLEEEERRRRQVEEEERLRKLREEEEERIRQDELRRKLEEEEARKIEEARKKEENKFAGLKPAAAMFQKALEAKNSMQKSISGERIVTLRKGTISELRSKIFDSQPQEEPIIRRSKPVPKKIILDNSKKSEEKSPKKEKEEERKHEEEPAAQPDIQREKASTKDEEVKKKHEIQKKEEMKEEIEKPEDNKGSKRQSFISDFAALEKTYKILGMSVPKDQQPIVEESGVVKKRHNSEGRVKNKDKAKRKSAIVNPPENKPPEPNKQDDINESALSALDKLDKGRAANKKNFFQTLINEKKGLVKKEPELMGPKLRKHTSMTQTFESNNDDELKRRSIMKEDIKVDKKQFNSFLDKFESKDQRADAKNKMIKITKQQKEFEKRKQKLEEEQMLQAELERKREEERLEREQKERELQLAMEEEARQAKLREEEEERIRILELERKSNELNNKRKVVRKKKKNLDENQDERDMPKLNLSVNSYTDVKKKFEKKKNSKEEPKELLPQKSLRINKLANNPFLESSTVEEKPQKQEVRVNKLQKNAFMMELEKMSSTKEEIKPEQRIKKISSEAHIKFESKKEKNVHKPDIAAAEPAEKKVQVHVSKSIEGHHPKKKNSKENKTGSTISLQKIFIDGPKNFLKSSKEKLYKLSKENLYEIQKPIDPKPLEPKLSKSEMQNYLLSHVLFDGSDMKKDKKEKVIKEEEDDIDKYLDQEYKDKINQYCSLLEEDKQPKRKKKKKKKVEDKKVEEKAPTMKLVEIKSIQQQLFQQQNQSMDKTSKHENIDITRNESKVNKFKELFDNDNEKPDVERRSNKEIKKPRAKSDIFQKIQALEKAEQERLEREKANEERMKKLLLLELDRQKEREIDETDCSNEENFKNDIMKCLEDEVENLEQEMLALETEEKLILEEENEEANDEIWDTENDEDNQEIEMHLNQLHEIQHEIEERKKTAANKKKVLERFQHVLDNEKEESNKGIKVGSIKDRLTNFLENGERKNVKSLDESVFVGVSDVMSKFKSKIEGNDEDPHTLFSRDEIKRKPNAIALQFEQMKYDDEEDVMSPKVQPAQKDWNWKKKTAQELHNEAEGTKEKVYDEPKKKSSYQDAKFNELLADIDAVKQRLSERDAARQEKENERKLREMEEALKEVQDALKYDDSEEDDYVEPAAKFKSSSRRVKEQIKEIKNPDPILSSNQKIGELKSQLMSMINDDSQEKTSKMENIDVNVSQLKNKLISNEENTNKSLPKTNKSQSSSTLVSKLAKTLTEDNDTDETPLTKAPKRIQLVDNIFETEEPPTKTLEELKEANQNKKWAWKDKDMTDIQNYIIAYDDVAPNNLKTQHQKLKDLDDEQKVVESLTKDNDTAILVQIREEKEQEFEKFMEEIHSYLAEGTKSIEEIEFKKGMKDYVDLIQESDSKSESKVTLPKVQLNTVSKMKTALFEDNEDVTPKKPSPKIMKLDKSKLEKDFSDNNSTTSKKNDLSISNKNIMSAKQAFENVKKDDNSKTVIQKDPAKSLSIVEKFKKQASMEKQRRLQHQLQHKLKTVSELHDYIRNHESLASETLLLHVRSFQISKETEKLKCHSDFTDCLSDFLNQNNKSDEEKIFRSNIQAYLSILNNVDSIYNATPKLRKHNCSGNFSQSNMKRAIIEKSCERKVPTKVIDPQTTFSQNNISKNVIQQKERVLSPEEKKKQILAKYGFKDRSAIEVQEISDDSDSSDSDEEEDIKQLTDRQLAEKFGLPYIELPEENITSKQQQNSTTGYTSLLSKIRTLGQEKTHTVTQNKNAFERRDSAGIEKSDSMAKVRKIYESDLPSSNARNSPSFESSNNVTMRIKNKLTEQQPIERKSWLSENEDLIKYGSANKMKQKFENDSPDSSRCNSPARLEPGTIMTSKMKKLFEDNQKVAEPQTPTLMNRSLMKSSTISNVGAFFQNENQSPALKHREIQSPAVRQKIVDKYLNQERNKEQPNQSPSMNRTGAIEKSKSLSKIKNAFEFGKGLNDEMEDVSDLQSRKSIHAELELLRSPSSKEISSPASQRRTSTSSPATQRRTSQPEIHNKSNLVASFFSGQQRDRSGSFTKERGSLIQKKVDSPKLLGGLQKSSTASDISSYLKGKYENKTSESPKNEASPYNINKTAIQPGQTASFTPELERRQGLAKSSSFSKFKDAFEDGVGLMDSENIDADKFKVNAELNAIKSSNKIQSMFRINKSKAPQTENQHSQDTSSTGNKSPNKSVSTPKEQSKRQNQGSPSNKDGNDDGELQGRKWVFDTIQKYFDVIVEEGEEDEEEGAEDDEDDDERANESESDYTSAEDEIPDITLPPINKTLPTRQLASTTYKEKTLASRGSPTYSLPVQRARASTSK